MRKLTVTLAIIAVTVLAGATTVSVTAQAQVKENTKFPSERLMEIRDTMGGTL